MLAPHLRTDDRPPRGAKRLVSRLRELVAHTEHGMHPAAAWFEVKAALREMDRRNEIEGQRR